MLQSQDSVLEVFLQNCVLTFLFLFLLFSLVGKPASSVALVEVAAPLRVILRAEVGTFCATEVYK